MINDKDLPVLADKLMPWLARKKFATGTVNTVTSTATTVTSTSGASQSALDALSASLETHKALDFVAAHVTNDTSVNVRREYWADNFGFAFDGTTDDGNALQRMFDTIGAAGGGIVHVASQSSTGSMYYDKTISCYYDNMDIRFHKTPMISGATGCIRIMGSQDEFTRKGDGTAIKLHVNSTTNGSNQTVLEMSAVDTALMDAEAVVANRIVVVGDKLSIRGLNDVSGKAIQKDTTFVASLAKVGSYWQITCTDELDYTFQPTYTSTSSPITSSDWPPDATTGTTIYIVRYATFTADLPAGSWFVQVNSITGFAVGDVIQVGDSRTENQYNASALKSGGTPYANPAALELVRIRGFNLTGGDSNVIYFDRATVDAYISGSTYHGGCARYVPVRNSHLSGANITYNAHQTSTSYNGLQQTYAVDCSIHDNFVDGIGGRAAHAIRTSYALNCLVYNNNVRDCYDSSSGRGYGITLYYCTGCYGWSNIVAGCRHNYLHQLAIQCGLWDCESRNHLGTGFDFHGVNSRFCFVHNCTCTSVNNNTSDSSINNAYAIQVGNTSHTCGDHNITISDCRVYFNHGSSDGALAFVPASSDVIFTNCVVYNANIGIRMILNSSQITPVQTATNIKLLDCHFINCSLSTDSDFRPFKLQGQPTYDGSASTGKLDKLTIRNCIDDGNSRHLEIVGVAGITNVIIDNYLVMNNVSTAGHFGILVSDVVGLMIRSCDLTGSNKGISLTNCTGPARIIGNAVLGLIDGTPAQYYYVDGGGNTSAVFQGNYTDTGIQPAGTSQWTPTGSDIYYNTGKVGVGNTAPARELDITDLSGSNVAIMRASTANTAANSHSILTLENQNTSANTIVGLGFAHGNGGSGTVAAATVEASLTVGTVGAETGWLRFCTMISGTLAERMRIDTSGNLITNLDVAIGTRLYVNDYIWGPGGNYLVNTYQDLTVGGGSGSGNLTVNGTINTGRAAKVTRVDGSLSSSTTTTSSIPHDGTKPQDSEGLQVVSTSYTPNASGNTIEIECHIGYIQVSAADPITLAIFQSGSANAIGVFDVRPTSGGSSGMGIRCHASFVTSGVSALTLQARIGSNAPVTITLNSKYNGLDMPYLLIREYV